MKTTTRTFNKGYWGAIVKYTLQFILGIIVYSSISYEAFAQTCASTSNFPYEWPSHRNWFMAPNGPGIIRNMSTGASTASASDVTAYEGVSSASDDNGNLLFYTNGRRLWRAGGASFAFGGLLEGNESGNTTNNGSASQGVIIVRHPLKPNDYYVFTTDDVSSSPAVGFNYAVFSPTGTVTKAVSRLGTYKTAEGIAATRHANGVDIWITVREGYPGTSFHTYLLTCNGVTNGTTSAVTTGPGLVSNLASSIQSEQGERGGLAFNYNGTKLAAVFPNFWPNAVDEVCLYDFNNATGAITNKLSIGTGARSPYDVLFSPDGTRLYVSEQNATIYYYTVTSGVAATILASRTPIGGGTNIPTDFSSMEIGPNGSLYYTRTGNLYQLAGNLNSAASFTTSVVAGTTGSTSYGLPTIYLPPEEFVEIDQVGPFCTTDAAVNLNATFFCSGKNAEDATNFPNAYSGTGITNTGTGIFNPATAGAGSHVITFDRCGKTHQITIVVSTCGCPQVTGTPTISGTATFCTGGNTTLTGNVPAGNNSFYYEWYNVTTGTSLSTGTIGTASATTIASPTITTAGTYRFRLANNSTNINNASCYKEATQVVTVNTPVSITTQPTASTTLCPGQAYNISVVATGTATITYQWKKNGTNIPSATSASFSIASVAAGDAATYTVDVTNTCGTVTSSNAVLVVRTPVSITTQPTASTTLCPGQAYNISVVATGTATLTYQWKKNGTNIPSATSASFSIASVAAGDAATYTVDVTNACGTVTSSNAVLVVNTPISITTQPTASTTLCPGQAYNISVAASGTATITYQWKKNGTNIPSATSASFSIASVAAGDAATYTVDVTNTCGTVTSSNAVLVVRTPVSITTQPTASTTLCVGQTYNISVVATGTATLTYQWKKNGTNIPSATNASFSIASVATGDAATYTVDVTNACGTVTSSNAVLIVNTLTAITTQPLTPITLCVPAALNLSVAATGSGTLTYQWKKGGTNIPGATSSSYSIASTATTDAGSYSVDVTGACGTVTSNTSVVTINEASITTQPTDQTTCATGNATFVSAATGVGLTYQWQLDNGGGFADIGGATSATYTVSGATVSQSGYKYRVIVKSNGLCTQTSNTAVLNVNSSTTINNQPVGGNYCAGDPITLSVNAGGAGTVTYQWKKNGIDIGGATNSTYTIASAVLTDAGSYTVDINSTCGPASSTAAVVNVNGVTITTQPSDVTVCAGTAVALTAAATGPGITYQWQVDNGGGFTDIGSATSANYTISAASVTTAINGYKYRVVIKSNGFCTVNSNAATVTITPNTVITTQPVANTDLCAGQPLNLTVVTSGPGTPTYQWSKDGAPIAGATSASYSVASVALTDAGTYTVVVTGTCGPVTSNNAVVKVNGVTITTQPTSQATCNNGSVTFTVVATGPVLTYQWQMNPSGTGTFADIPGATSASLAINPATPGMNGNTYRVNILSNGLCPVTSDVVTLTVNNNTAINTQPVGGNYCAGDALNLSVSGSGTGTPTYQWYLNNTAIAGATNATYSVASIAAADAGSYKVDVTTSCGTITSNVVVVKVNSVTINTQPVNAHVCQGSNTSFSVVATGLGTLSYQWQVGNGSTFTDISGQTSSSYNLTTAITDDNNQYRVVIKDDNACDVTSNVATLLVDAVTVITTQPTSTSACEGSPFSLSVVATTEGTPTYTWTPDSRSVGSNSTYSVASALPSDAGSYSVTVANSGLCPSVTSNVVTVTITPTPLKNLPVTAPDICLNSAGTITVGNSQNNVTYQAYNGITPIGTPVAGNGGTITLSIPSSLLSTAGVHTFVVKADPGAGCPLVQLDNPGIINVIGAPGAVTGPTSVCTNANTGLLYSVTSVTPINNPVTYNWNVSGGTITSGTGTNSISVDLNATGAQGTITLTSVSTATATCPVNDSRVVKQVMDYTPEDVTISEDTICAGNTVTFTITNPNAVGYNWIVGPGVQDQSTSVNTPKVFRFDTPGDITISLKPFHPCRTTITPITRTIHVITPPVADAGSDVHLNNLVPITLDGRGSSTGIIYKYEWTSSDPGAVIQDPTLISTTSMPTELKSTYTITVSTTNTAGCSATDDMEVIIEPIVKIPNVFSPNNDNNHDVLVIQNIQFFPNCVLYIYNQWGELIYKSETGYRTPWDGTRGGKECAVSAYYYVLELNQGDYKPLSGSVTIVR